jgi:hypothetical protein
VLILLGLPGCGLVSHGEPDPQVEEARALGLPEGARLHRVTLGGRGATEHAVPPLIQARPGDGVEFLTEDHRVHTVTFPADSLEPEVHAFLEASGQLGSPPLVSRGTRFVLQLRDAPTWTLPFCERGARWHRPRGAIGGAASADLEGGAETDMGEPGRSITRKEFDEIIRRAAEIAASEPESGDAVLTEQDLFRIAREVGLEERHVRKALVQVRSSVPPARGPMSLLYGPSIVVASRVVPGTRETVGARDGRFHGGGQPAGKRAAHRCRAPVQAAGGLGIPDRPSRGLHVPEVSRGFSQTD